MSGLPIEGKRQTVRSVMIFLVLSFVAFGPPNTSAAEEAENDERFSASIFLGIGVDTFAATDLDRYLNPEDSGDVKERFVTGFDFDYRLAGKDNVQLWLYGETVYGVRSTEVDCNLNNKLSGCGGSTAEQSLFIIRNASSLEAFIGFRLEIPAWVLNDKHEDSVANPYVKSQVGFLSVAGGSDDVIDMRHVGVGLIAKKGRYEGSYIEVGYGHNDIFLVNPRERWLVDGFLTWRPEAWGRRGTKLFAQIVVDVDVDDGSDSIQSYFGFDIDPVALFGG